MSPLNSSSLTQVSRQLRLSLEIGSIRFHELSNGLLTCCCDGPGDVYDLIEHIFHHDMVLYVNKVVRADDRFERMVCQILSGVTTGSRLEQRWLEVDRFGWDMVSPVITVRDIERLGGLENQDDEVESLFICELTPECRGKKDVVKYAYISSQPRNGLYRQRHTLHFTRFNRKLIKPGSQQL